MTHAHDESENELAAAAPDAGTEPVAWRQRYIGPLDYERGWQISPEQPVFLEPENWVYEPLYANPPALAAEVERLRKGIMLIASTVSYPVSKEIDWRGFSEHSPNEDRMTFIAETADALLAREGEAAK